MTVKEYREKKPHCKYCKYIYEFYGYYCEAKEQSIFFNKAKKCEIYQAKEKV